MALTMWEKWFSFSRRKIPSIHTKCQTTSGSTENKKMSIWHLCHHWWHHELLWQLTVPPVTRKLSNWWPSVFRALLSPFLTITLSTSKRYAHDYIFWYLFAFFIPIPFTRILDLFTGTRIILWLPHGSKITTNNRSIQKSQICHDINFVSPAMCWHNENPLYSG